MKNITYIFNIKRSVLVLASLLLFVSCEEFLEDELLSDTSVDFLYGTENGLETAVVGLYSLNRDRFNSSFTTLILQAKSDLSLGRAGAVTLYSRLKWGISLGDYGTVGGYDKSWRQHYKIVDRANAIIAAAETLEGIDEDKKNQILAEAKAFRAQAYFTLYRQFNNIFITTEPTTPENAFDRPQDKSSEEEIFNLLKSDLDFAITNLEYKTDQFGRWTKGSTRHLRSKVAMWQKDWAEAAKQTDSIILNGTYSLEGSTKDVFSGDLSKNETLFAIQLKDETVGGGKKNFMSWKMIPQYHRVEGVHKSDQNGGSGAGFLMLNNYLRNLLKEDPNDDRANASYYISNYFYNEGDKVGDTIKIYDQNSDDDNEKKKYYLSLNPGVLKFRDENAPPETRDNYKNIMVYRLAETYLIGAEAHMMNGNTATALEYINAVRNRANAASIDAVDLKIILEERARELAFEGQRWYTLKRTGKLLEYLEDHMGNADYNQFYASGDPRELIKEMPFLVHWPIPIKQKDLLGPNYPQNPGYE